MGERKKSKKSLGRREFMGRAFQVGAATGAAGLVGPALVNGATPLAAGRADSKQKSSPTADTCIFVWLAGGMCHLDTFDPKRMGNGADIPGSYFPSIKTAVPGVEVCEHLPELAARMDRIAILRTLFHNFPNHTQGVDFFHTGRPPTGTVVYPSIGSIVAHEVGGFDPKAPAYVVVGYPMRPRGPGFLGGKANYIYVVDTEAGPSGLRVPGGVTPDEYESRIDLLEKFSRPWLEQHSESQLLEGWDQATHKGFEMMSRKFQSAFTVKEEPSELRERYGEEFGQRLLLSRRLVENGVRFVECSFNLHFINGYGWDAHSFAQKRVHLLIRQLDRAVATLIDDLEKKKMLDRTLVVVATEFGRPAGFDGQGGRGHQSQAFSVIMFGGGIQQGQAVGITDELGEEIVERPISIADFHATIHHALGIDPEKYLMTPDGRPVPITDFGEPVLEVFS